MASKKGAAASIKWVALLQTNWGVISSLKEHFAVLPIFLTLYRHLFLASWDAIEPGLVTESVSESL